MDNRLNEQCRSCRAYMAESSLEEQESRDHYFVRNLIKDPEASRDFDPGPFTQAKRFAHQILHPSLIIVRFPQTSTLLWLNRLLLLSGYHPPRLQAVCSGRWLQQSLEPNHLHSGNLIIFWLLLLNLFILGFLRLDTSVLPCLRLYVPTTQG